MKYINYFVYLTIVVALIPISLFYFSYKTKVGRIDKKEIIDKLGKYTLSPDGKEAYNEGALKRANIEILINHSN